jgi:hypothetical protein
MDQNTTQSLPEGLASDLAAELDARGGTETGHADGTAHSAGEDVIAIHPGLPWMADPAGTKKIVAKSPCHKATWVIDLEDGAAHLWRAFPDSDFFELDIIAAEPYGRFDDHREAARRAEQADFQIFRRLAHKRGQRAELKGGQAYNDAAFGGDSRSFILAASFFEAKTKGLKKNQNGSWDLSLNIDADVPRWLIDAPLGELVEVGLVALGSPEDLDGAEARKRIEDAQRRAALRPGEPDFQQWLMTRYDRWNLLKDAASKTSIQLEEAAAETVRRLIGIPSRADFKTNIDAVRAFEALDREFYFDMAAAKGVWTPRR